MVRDQEYPTPLEAELNALRKEAERLGGLHSFGTFDARLTRLEGIVQVLVRALQIKGALELEEVHRELDH